MRTVGVWALLVILLAGAADAATWSRRYINQLPDSAFALIESAADGKPLRRLPHHDHRGALDLAHLCSALARWHQVKWRGPANAKVARRHLEAHLQELGPKACRPRTAEP